MQRRAGGRARIAPPIQLSPLTNNEKRSRLSQRILGVTNRIWALIALILVIILFTHYASPTSHSPQQKTILRPKVYLNDTTNPFKFCPLYGSGDEVGKKYGAQILAKTVIHQESGDRVQRLLTRALAGQPVTISIIGGSVSACHGAGDDPVSSKCYPSLFFKWWNSVFPHPATELTNGAMRRTSSGYFGFCSAHHLPDVTDLIVIELDSEESPGEQMMENFETLIRSLLLRADNPAILLLGHFSPQVQQAYGFTGPDHWHTPVAQFYDVPYISIKPALYTSYMGDQRSVDKYYVDPVLSSPLGHELMQDILIVYFQSQICRTWEIISNEGVHIPDDVDSRRLLFGGAGLRKGVPEPENDADKKDKEKDKNPAKRLQPRVPPTRINTKPNSAHAFEEISPFCVSANDLINPLPPSLFYGSGWNVHHPPPSSGPAGMQTTSHYWYSTLPTSKIRIPLQVGAGDIGIYYLIEPEKAVGEGSKISCWVDDNHGGAKIIGNAGAVGEATPRLEVIDHFVTRGSHFVECILQGEEGRTVPMFKIIGIFST